MMCAQASGVGGGVVVREVGEARLGRDEGQAVGLELVDLARHLQAARVAVGRAVVAGRFARALEHGHVEARVVRHEHVVAGERREVVELLAPALRRR